MKHPKEKGSRLERTVAKLLSEWSGYKFIRTPMSGAIHNFKDKRVVSDITAPLSIGDWPFSIECKNTENNWELNTYIEGTAVFWKQWEQCLADSQREDLKPMLVFSKNYRDIFVAVTEIDFLQMGLDVPNKVVIHALGKHLVVFKFKDFLSSIDLPMLLKKFKKI